MSISIPTLTGYAGFWERTGDFVPYAPLGRSVQGWRSKLEWKVAQLAGKQQFRELNALFRATIGASAGGTAASTYKRRQAPTNPSAASPTVTGVGDMGGLIDIETVTVINRATTAADISYLKNMFDGTMYPGPNSITFPVDLSTNGGGSKAGW
jgi:hypothetical protein